MKSHFRIKAGIVTAVAGVVVMAGLAAFRAQADEWDKMTLLTVSEPTQVMNTYLEPGTYMFKLANTDRHIVQIFTSDRSHLINTIIAIPNYRVEVSSRPTFTFWETPPGSAKAVRAWFYPGDHYGQEFTYPTELRQVAALTPPSIPAPAPPEPAVIPPPPPPPPAPEPQAEEVAPPQEQAPVEIAQNQPPPPAPEPAPQAAPQPDQSQNNEPQALPQTGSPYPMIGLGGLIAFGLYLGLKVKQFR